MNAVCVIWNSLQIAHSVGRWLTISERGADRCRC